MAIKSRIELGSLADCQAGCSECPQMGRSCGQKGPPIPFRQVVCSLLSHAYVVDTRVKSNLVGAFSCFRAIEDHSLVADSIPGAVSFDRVLSAGRTVDRPRALSVLVC
jgi:hypothetical protein